MASSSGVLSSKYRIARLAALARHHRNAAIVERHLPGLIRREPEQSGKVGAVHGMMADNEQRFPGVAFHRVCKPLRSYALGAPLLASAGLRVGKHVAAAGGSVLTNGGNPCNGAGLSEWTDNPRIARLRWIEDFRKPAAEAVRSSIGSAESNSSPIMAAIQDIAIDQFSSAASQNARKTLYVISDMIEYTRDYSQYPRAGDLSFQRYKQSAAYLKFRTDLHGATVIIRYVTRQAGGQPLLDGTKHMEFWKAWIEDNRGAFGGVKRLQGA